MRSKPSLVSFHRLSRLALSGMIAGAVCGSGFASESTASLIEGARTALAEKLPQIALHKLEQAARQEEESTPEAAQLRAEALMALGRADEALELIEPLLQTGDRSTELLRAHCLAAAGRWTDARIAYTHLANQPDAPLSARIGVAEACQAVGDTASAIAALEPVAKRREAPPAVRLRLASFYVEAEQGSRARKILSETKPITPEDKLWERYIEGRLYLLERQASAARGVFSEIIGSGPEPHVSENLFVAATLGAVDARIALQGNEAADNELETFIWRYPDSAWLEMVFRRLDQIYASERNPAESELQKWATKQQRRRAALAQYYVSKLQVRGKKWDKALLSLNTFVRRHPEHPFIPFVQLMRADVLIEKRQFEQAVQALEAAARVAGENEALRGEVELRTGLVQFRQREFLLAATSFDRAAERTGPVGPIARYDAALAWLNQTNYDRFLEEFQRLGNRGLPTELRGNLALEEGLLRARMKDPAAREVLRRFATQFPNHPRLGEARLAEAELAFQNRRFTEASQLLRVANERSRSPEIDDHGAYLAIFLADARKPTDEAEVIRLATEFLRQRPKSHLVPEVRMKLGQVYFNQPDYPNAETQFATLAQETPASPYAETALFLAGQAAMRTINPGSTERALGYFDEVVKRAGPLRLHAREQQAIIQSNAGKEQEAVALYDLIIQSKQPVAEPELRGAAFIGKGDALGRTSPPQLEAAAAVYAELAAEEGVSPSWRNQALYKRARMLDQLGRKADAIAVLNEVLDRTLEAGGREFFWFYKAGFEAARHFEEQSAWPSAIAIYEKMARIEGPRAAEAQKTARLRRVEHFVWD